MDNQKSIEQLSSAFGVEEKQIIRIKKKYDSSEKRARLELLAETNPHSKSAKKSLCPVFEATLLNDVALFEKISVPISLTKLQFLATLVKHDVLSAGLISDKEKVYLSKFKASAGWTEKFLDRNRISIKGFAGDSKDANVSSQAEEAIVALVVLLPMNRLTMSTTWTNSPYSPMNVDRRRYPKSVSGMQQLNKRRTGLLESCAAMPAVVIKFPST